MIESVSLLKPHSKDWRRQLLFQCEDKNARVKKDGQKSWTNETTEKEKEKEKEKKKEGRKEVERKEEKKKRKR